MLMIISLFSAEMYIYNNITKKTIYSRMFISTEAVIYSMFVSTTVIMFVSTKYVSTTVIMFVSTTVMFLQSTFLQRL